jgi:hypothetical protein
MYPLAVHDWSTKHLLGEMLSNGQHQAVGGDPSQP